MPKPPLISQGEADDQEGHIETTKVSRKRRLSFFNDKNSKLKINKNKENINPNNTCLSNGAIVANQEDEKIIYMTRAKKEESGVKWTKWDKKLFANSDLHTKSPEAIARKITVSSEEIDYTVIIELDSNATLINNDEEINAKGFKDFLPGCTKIADKKVATPNKHNMMDVLMEVRFKKEEHRGKSIIYGRKRPATLQKIDKEADELFKLAYEIPEIKVTFDEFAKQAETVKLRPKAIYDPENDKFVLSSDLSAGSEKIFQKNIKMAGTVIDSQILHERWADTRGTTRNQNEIMKGSASVYAGENGIKPSKLQGKGLFVWGHMAPYSFNKQVVHTKKNFKTWLHNQPVESNAFGDTQSANNLACISEPANVTDTLIENLARFICVHYKTRVGWWVKQRLLPDKEVGKTKKITIYLPEKDTKFTISHDCLQLTKGPYSMFKYMLFTADKVLSSNFSCQNDLDKFADKAELEASVKDEGIAEHFDMDWQSSLLSSTRLAPRMLC